MSTIKENAKKYATKAKHFAIGAAMVPLMGVGAHIGNSIFAEGLSDHSLHDRFETAYSFKTPEAHKYYYETRSLRLDELFYADDETWENGGEYIEERRYLASPWATYPAMLAFGLLGISMGAANEKGKRNKNIMNVIQHTR